jgi:hypothetical protein
MLERLDGWFGYEIATRCAEKGLGLGGGGGGVHGVKVNEGRYVHLLPTKSGVKQKMFMCNRKNTHKILSALFATIIIFQGFYFFSLVTTTTI